jgi:hypothetical protein
MVSYKVSYIYFVELLAKFAIQAAICQEQEEEEHNYIHPDDEKISQLLNNFNDFSKDHKFSITKQALSAFAARHSLPLGAPKKSIFATLELLKQLYLPGNILTAYAHASDTVGTLDVTGKESNKSKSSSVQKRKKPK